MKQNPAPSLFYKKISTPVGQLKLVASDKALVAILWETEKKGRVSLGKMKLAPNHPLLQKAQKQLQAYFSGKRKSFDLTVEPVGTAFQTKVWRALSRIPFGEVRSYAQLAQEIGSPKASRAVGAANGRNPLSIVVPCHRVIGSNRKLTGFAGGLKNKEILLKLEKVKLD